MRRNRKANKTRCLCRYFIKANSITCSAVKSKPAHTLNFCLACKRKQSPLDCCMCPVSLLWFCHFPTEQLHKLFLVMKSNDSFVMACQKLLFPAIASPVFLHSVKVKVLYLTLQISPWNPKRSRHTAPSSSQHLPKQHDLPRLTTASVFHT